MLQIRKKSSKIADTVMDAAKLLKNEAYRLHLVNISKRTPLKTITIQYYFRKMIKGVFGLSGKDDSIRSTKRFGYCRQQFLQKLWML
uniref:Uncharacterized protein n=1 Tax=Tanacetum cinerariifolium TaxID=118510 RepID=A0A6L2MXU5_TANCI|nr:hypothetical protein [Tanacetum cinerariifolium]